MILGEGDARFVQRLRLEPGIDVASKGIESKRSAFSLASGLEMPISSLSRFWLRLAADAASFTASSAKRGTVGVTSGSGLS
jgi:hypothetical protein